MTTWTYPSKSATSFSYDSKSTSTFTNELSLGRTQYLLTEALEYILVGENEDETLILWGDTEFVNIAKS